MLTWFPWFWCFARSKPLPGASEMRTTFERKDTDLFSLSWVGWGHGTWSFHQGYLWVQGCFLEDISSGSIPRPRITYHREIVSRLFNVRPWFLLAGLRAVYALGLYIPILKVCYHLKAAFAFGTWRVDCHNLLLVSFLMHWIFINIYGKKEGKKAGRKEGRKEGRRQEDWFKDATVIGPWELGNKILFWELIYTTNS